PPGRRAPGLPGHGRRRPALGRRPGRDRRVGPGIHVKAIATIAELRTALDGHRAAGRTVGFVPTMGYLHDGHASLLRAARQRDDVVVTSIFVNPLQFGAGEDLDAYPRDLARDTALAAEAGVDVLFTPSVTDMYPRPVLTTVSVAQVSEGLEGAT